MQLETPACGRRSCPHLVAGNSRWQCVMVTSCTWSFHLHFEPLLKCKWDFLTASCLDAWQHFCLICDLSSSCYRHKMQLGTLACQEKIICTVNGRSICILGRPQNANEISCPLSYLDAWQQFCLIHGLSAFCYCHKMQLETPACGRRSCPHLVAGNSRWQCVMVTSCTWSFHLHFEPLLKCKWDFLTASCLDAWQHFCLICDLSSSCYRHKMQLGTLACQEKIICTVNGRSICILGRPQNANQISCPLVT